MVGDVFTIQGTEGEEKFSGDLAYCMSMASTDACAASTASVAVWRSPSIAADDSGRGPDADGGNGNGFTGDARGDDTGRAGGVGACSTVMTDGDTAVADPGDGRVGDGGAARWWGRSEGAGNGEFAAGDERPGTGAGAGARGGGEVTSPTSLGGSAGAALAAVTAAAALLAASTARSSANSARISRMLSSHSAQLTVSGWFSPTVFRRTSRAFSKSAWAGSSSFMSTSKAPRLAIRVATWGCSAPSVRSPMSMACS